MLPVHKNLREAAMIGEVPPQVLTLLFFLLVVWLECRTWTSYDNRIWNGTLGQEKWEMQVPIGLNYARGSLFTDCQKVGDTTWTEPWLKWSAQRLSRKEPFVHWTDSKLSEPICVNHWGNLRICNLLRALLNCLSTRDIVQGER